MRGRHERFERDEVECAAIEIHPRSASSVSAIIAVTVLVGMSGM
mgnify:CR=1 FL=1